MVEFFTLITYYYKLFLLSIYQALEPFVKDSLDIDMNLMSINNKLSNIDDILEIFKKNYKIIEKKYPQVIENLKHHIESNVSQNNVLNSLLKFEDNITKSITILITFNLILIIIVIILFYLIYKLNNRFDKFSTKLNKKLNQIDPFESLFKRSF